jgi:hypothetical protein
MEPDGRTFVDAAMHETIFFNLEKAYDYIVSPPEDEVRDIPAAFVVLAMAIQRAASAPEVEAWQLANLYEEIHERSGGEKLSFSLMSALNSRLERFKRQADHQYDDASLSSETLNEWADHLALGFVPTLAKSCGRVEALGAFEHRMVELVGPQQVTAHVCDVLRAVC